MLQCASLAYSSLRDDFMCTEVRLFHRVYTCIGMLSDVFITSCQIYLFWNKHSDEAPKNAYKGTYFFHPPPEISHEHKLIAQ